MSSYVNFLNWGYFTLLFPLAYGDMTIRDPAGVSSGQKNPYNEAL